MSAKRASACIVVALLLTTPPCFAAMTLAPGILSAEDLTADPEPVTQISVGTDEYDEATFGKELEETFNLEVYELTPGLYQFVNDPAAKDDQVALNSDIAGFDINSIIADSGADGILMRGMGRYPGETAISFGLINVYPDVPRTADGEMDIERAAGELGYQFFTGQRYFVINGAIAVFENMSIGDHGNNNTGVIQTRGGGKLFMNDVWIYNVYDGLFFREAADGYLVNCILHQTYQPWSSLDDANADLYFTDDWFAFITPDELGGTPFAEGMNLLGVDVTEEKYPEVAGVILRNDATWGSNITLVQTRSDPDPQYIYMKNCTLVKHLIYGTNRLWRHNTGSGLGVAALFEDCMILSLDTTTNNQIRLDTDELDFLGNVLNSKFWNYASDDANVTGMTNWMQIDVDTTTPGGLDISDVSELFRLDARKLTTFKPGSIELTLASDGGPVGYRLPATAPDGPLTVTEWIEPVGVHLWMLH